MGLRLIRRLPHGSTSRVPWMATATMRICERSAVAKAPPRNLPICAAAVERALRKEDQGLAGGRELPHAARVRSALVAVEALDERGPEAPQQQAGERHAHHLLLDDEGKVRRQCRDGDDAVDVAGVIRDHHARFARAWRRRPWTRSGMPAARKNPREHAPATRRRARSPGKNRLIVRAIMPKPMNNARQ